MKIRVLILLLITLSCGTSKNSSAENGQELEESLQQKNSVTISLLNRIRQKPGVIIRNGVPIINKTSNSLSNQSDDPSGMMLGSPEPLYVLNGYPVGNSFRDIDRLVDSINVTEIVVLTGADASSYGARGAKGVILITTQ
ncbi:TonB-dependent receptor plug domain-containing protein [Muriicola marianensis]|uniref:TonB-dependent receptor plug domain-containing protein n=1 Tax=Muriicola marianensis TaxID=1324801 RepID=A0ABQ1QVG0_9FLAO|nr:TonB-dependent receptor plug domain-containing protein [Muriicola marianensis]GGD48296.1 hypothetical protein GCM10011361_13870 [Muriicola marianensis]